MVKFEHRGFMLGSDSLEQLKCRHVSISKIEENMWSQIYTREKWKNEEIKLESEILLIPDPQYHQQRKNFMSTH